jgi:hypothetical protein
MLRVAIALLFAAAGCFAQDSFERVLQFSRVRQKMTETLNHLPDFTCVATAQRSIQRAGQNDYKVVDTLRYEIAHAGNKELWSWPGAPQFQDTPLTAMIQNGAISDGDFALHARSVFVDNVATVKYVGPENLDGRRTLRWNYNIPMLVSGWRIAYASRSELAASHGAFWVDTETLEVERLEVHAEGLPADFPINEVVSTIDYARARIGQLNVLLPQTAELFIEQTSGERRRNVTEFSHCRQYSGQVAISFDAPVSAAIADPEKIEEISLAPGLRVHLKLKTAIDSSAVIGDAVTATLVGDVVQNGSVLVPAGAVVTGRIRRLEKRDDGTPYYIVGIEFDDLSFRGHHARFFGSLKGLDREVPGFQWYMGAPALKYEGSNGITKVTMERNLHLDELPGVGTFFMTGSRFRLPEGTTMVWETVSQGSTPRH